MEGVSRVDVWVSMLQQREWFCKALRQDCAHVCREEQGDVEAFVERTGAKKGVISCRTLQTIIKNLSFILREMRDPLDDFDGNGLA